MPVSLVARGPQIIVISGGALPVNDLRQFVDYAKKNPGKLSYSSAGIGSVGHLSSELLLSLLGIQAVHVPYKGGAPALNAVAAGETQFAVDAVGTTAAMVKSGRIKAIAVLSDKRTSFAPELPIPKEMGYPTVLADFWSGVVVPAGTTTDIVDRLNRAIVESLKKPDISVQMRNLGAEPQASSPAEFASFIQAESVKWTQVVRSADIKAE